MTTRSVGARAALALALAWPVAAAQAQGSAAATAPIEALQKALAAIDTSNAGFAARADQIAPVVDQALDLQAILKASVGLSYASIPPAKAAQLLAVFRRYTIANYVSNFSGTGDKFTVSPDTRQGGNDTIVQTTLTGTDGSTTRIDYVMQPSASGGDKATDVLLDGTISRVAVQRSDFRSVLDEGGPDALIAKLSAKVTALSHGELKP